MLVVRFLIPCGGQESFLIHALYVRAVGAVNDDAPPARGEADDSVPGHRRATARKADQKPRLTVDEDAARRPAPAVPRVHFEGLGHLLFIKVDEFEKHLIDGHRAVPYGGVHFLGSAERIAVGNALEAFVCQQSGKSIALFLSFFFEPRLTDANIVLFQFVFIKLFYFRLGAGRLDKFQPVPGRSFGVRGSDDLHHISDFQSRRKGHDLGIDPRARAAVAHLRVNGVGKVHRRRSGRQGNDFSPRREYQ